MVVPVERQQHMKVFLILLMRHIYIQLMQVQNYIGKLWYGIEKVIKVYRDLCPVCLKLTKPSKAVIRSITDDDIRHFGSRAQMNLVDMHVRQVGKFKWILCYVDHRSGFGHSACLIKKAKTVERADRNSVSCSNSRTITTRPKRRIFQRMCLNGEETF